MAPHSSTLAWKIPWTEEPGWLQSMGSLRVKHDWATSLSLSCIGEGNGNPLQCSCLENPRDGGAWWAAIYAVAQSHSRLKRLSSSSRRIFWFFLIQVIFMHLSIVTKTLSNFPVWGKSSFIWCFLKPQTYFIELIRMFEFQLSKNPTKYSSFNRVHYLL